MSGPSLQRAGERCRWDRLRFATDPESCELLRVCLTLESYFLPGRGWDRNRFAKSTRERLKSSFKLSLSLRAASPSSILSFGERTRFFGLPLRLRNSCWPARFLLIAFS